MSREVMKGAPAARGAVESPVARVEVKMSRLLSRRKMMLGMGGAVAVAPLAFAGSAAADVTGQLVVLTIPVRLYDSRTDAIPLGRAKLSSGNSVNVTAGGGPSGALMAAFPNVPVTQPEGAGH